MICLFTTLSGSIINSLPINRYKCGANLNGSDYQLADLIDRDVEVIKETFQGTQFEFYLKVCDGFKKSDIPYSFPNLELYSFAVCLPIRKTCFPLASKFTLDYYPIDNSDMKKGINFFYDTEPNSQLSAFNDVLAYFAVNCDEKQTDPKAKATFTVNIGTDMALIHGSLNYKGACPKTVKAPTPTPMYEPQCEYETRDPDNQLKGIEMDLEPFNGGAHGHMWTDHFGGEDHVIFYQPCERMTNPANDTDDFLASVWVCDSKVTQCDDFGVADDHMNIDRDPHNINDPITNRIINARTARTTTVMHNCEASFPETQFKFMAADLSDDKYTLTMNLKSTASCVRDMKPDQPGQGKCHYYNNQTSDGTVDFDISKLNGPENEGYSISVQVKGGLGDPTRWLHFQPCGPVFCPKDAHCDQFEDAYVWLCDDVTLHNDSFVCKPYGLVKHNTRLSPISAFNPSAGVRMEYTGGDHLGASVEFTCDPSMQPGQMRLPNQVTVTNGLLSFEVRTADSCPSGVKPGNQTFTLKWPTKGATPTPTPMYHAEPHQFTMNKTHYVIVDLENADQNLQRNRYALNSKGRTMLAYQYFKPFDNFSCPDGYDCKEFKDTKANSWTCWLDENDDNVCFPTAMPEYGIEIEPLSKKNLDSGVSIRYQGGYNTDLLLKLFCSQSATTDLPLMDYGAAINLGGFGNSGVELIYDVNTKRSCPHAFEQAFQPPPPRNPTPKPDPEAYDKLVWSATFDEDGHNVTLDLRRFPTVQYDVAMGYDFHYEFASVLYSPVKRIPCMKNFDCSGYEDANVWKCFVNNSGRFCYPMGDARYGLELELAPNIRGIHGEAAAVYDGGASGYQTTMVFVCNYSVPEGGLFIHEAGELRQNKYAILYAHTPTVCWDYKPKDGGDSEVSKTTGGAVFLAVVGVSVVAYAVIGALVTFVLTGAVAFPQKAFWTEFFACVATGATFIGTCGRRTSYGVVNYDAI